MRRLLVGKARGPDQKQGLALVVRELGEGAAEILEIEARALLGLDLEPAGIGPVRVLHLAAALAVLGMEEVAKDGEEPGVQVRARLEPVQIGQGPQEGVLNEVVGPVDLAGQRDGKGAKAGNRREKCLPKLRLGLWGH